MKLKVLVENTRHVPSQIAQGVKTVKGKQMGMGEMITKSLWRVVRACTRANTTKVVQKTVMRITAKGSEISSNCWNRTRR